MADPTEQIELLREAIKSEIAKLNKGGKFWRPRAFISHLLTAIIGALITIIAGWQGAIIDESWFHWFPFTIERRNWLLLLGALITGVNAWQAFYNHRERWLVYASTSNQLRTLLAKLEFKSKSADFMSSEQGVQKIFDEFHEILDEFNRLQMTAMSAKSIGPESQ